ncbi:MAG: TIM barrel protein [Bryobacterales bacterium]|nr:TIM barrel protein [Bryobacterales bacterium]
MRRREICLLLPGALALPAAKREELLFARNNLVAWCIVPFDAKKRGPEERAALLKKLGFTKFVYDWRDKDIPDFDRELDALQKHGIKLQGFWTPYPMDPSRPSHVETILGLLKRRKIETELWTMLNPAKDFAGLSQDRKLEAASASVAALARQAGAIHCKVGLYNHGGWFGEPDNQVAVIERVKMRNVGIVYNFHHAHEQMDQFPQLLRKMLPHLLAVNINGMKLGTKILPVGDGDRELAMLQTLKRSGYRGPVGILGHREELDAEESLTLNLNGLKKLLPALGEEAARKTFE